MNSNPWEPTNETQRAWMEKWKHEDEVCKACNKHKQCTAADRMDRNICQNLRERVTGIKEPA